MFNYFLCANNCASYFTCLGFYCSEKISINVKYHHHFHHMAHIILTATLEDDASINCIFCMGNLRAELIPLKLGTLMVCGKRLLLNKGTEKKVRETSFHL